MDLIYIKYRNYIVREVAGRSKHLFIWYDDEIVVGESLEIPRILGKSHDHA